MPIEQVTLIIILIGMIALFIWDRLRHDFVAMAALLACVLFRLVRAEDAFSGFGHPAVITVASAALYP